MEKDVENIKKAMKFMAGHAKGVDLLTTDIKKNRMLQNLAQQLLPGFLGKLSDLLDEWGYYEVPSRRLKASDFKELEKNES